MDLLRKIKVRWYWFFYALGGFIAILMLWFTLAKPLVVLPRIKLAPGYRLQDAQWRKITSEDGRGQLTLYTFAFTNCQQSCSHIYQTLADLDALLASNPPALPVRYITITVDPKRDTPKQLASFTPPLKPSTGEWIWLTGDPVTISVVVRDGFGVFYSSNNGEIAFSPKVILVDGWGIIRSEYDATFANGDILFRDIQLVLKEIQNSKGSARLAYEAAHFFACYP